MENIDVFTKEVIENQSSEEMKGSRWNRKSTGEEAKMVECVWGILNILVWGRIKRMGRGREVSVAVSTVVVCKLL